MQYIKMTCLDSAVSCRNVSGACHVVSIRNSLSLPSGALSLFSFPELTEIVGDIMVPEGSIKALYFPKLTKMTGSIVAKGLGLNNITLGPQSVVTGDIRIGNGTNSGEARFHFNIKTVKGSLLLSIAGPVTFVGPQSAGAVTLQTGDVTCSGLQSIVSSLSTPAKVNLQFIDLITVGGSISLQTGAHSANFPKLAAAGSLQLTSCAPPGSGQLPFPMLTSVKGDLVYLSLPSTTFPQVDRLQTVGGNLDITQSVLPGGNGYDFPSLTSIGGHLKYSENKNFGYVITLPNLRTIGGPIYINNNQLSAKFNFTSLESICEMSATPALTMQDGISYVICPSNILPNLCNSLPTLASVSYPPGCDDHK
jgi:hypothetical protein